MTPSPTPASATRRPRCLDLFCGAGGAAMGLHQAGFDVVGVDITSQPRYPFAFHQADAMTFPLDGFDFIWASPPCQGYSRTRHLPWLKGKKHPLLIPATRARFGPLLIPWVIENVGDSPLRGIVLTGEMFGLPFRRLRVFESNVLLLAPSIPKSPSRSSGRMFGNRLRSQHESVDCGWMNAKERGEAIPPAYSRYIGEQIMPAVLRAVERRRFCSSLERKSGTSASPGQKRDCHPNTDDRSGNEFVDDSHRRSSTHRDAMGSRSKD